MEYVDDNWCITATRSCSPGRSRVTLAMRKATLVVCRPSLCIDTNGVVQGPGSVRMRPSDDYDESVSSLSLTSIPKSWHTDDSLAENVIRHPRVNIGERSNGDGRSHCGIVRYGTCHHVRITRICTIVGSTALAGSEYELGTGMIVIADQKGRILFGRKPQCGDGKGSGLWSRANEMSLGA